MPLNKMRSPKESLKLTGDGKRNERIQDRRDGSTVLVNHHHNNPPKREKMITLEGGITRGQTMLQRKLRKP